MLNRRRILPLREAETAPVLFLVVASYLLVYEQLQQSPFQGDLNLREQVRVVHRNFAVSQEFSSSRCISWCVTGKNACHLHRIVLYLDLLYVKGSPSAIWVVPEDYVVVGRLRDPEESNLVAELSRKHIWGGSCRWNPCGAANRSNGQGNSFRVCERKIPVAARDMSMYWVSSLCAVTN